MYSDILEAFTLMADLFHLGHVFQVYPCMANLIFRAE